ncbi:MAG: LptE family protein [Bacteroidales bacterium]|nr:LptE family protein [Bacteroidales bacterium]
MKRLRHIACILAIVMAGLTGHLVSSCGIYSFSGTSIQPDVKSITIPYVEYTALRVNPSLSNDLTEALKEKFRKLTRLEEVDVDGDLELVCTVTGYDVKATAVTANEMASQNRLTVTVKIEFSNKKYPEDDVSNNFSAYEDFDATLSLDAVESGLCETIIEKLVEDIFNATVAQW